MQESFAFRGHNQIHVLVSNAAQLTVTYMVNNIQHVT
jgi:hypothetical protein